MQRKAARKFYPTAGEIRLAGGEKVRASPQASNVVLLRLQARAKFDCPQTCTNFRRNRPTQMVSPQRCCLKSLLTSSMGKSCSGWSLKPVILRKVTSSAPSWKYRPANSTGFPRFRTSPRPFPYSRHSIFNQGWSPVTGFAPRSKAAILPVSKLQLQTRFSVRGMHMKGEEGQS